MGNYFNNLEAKRERNKKIFHETIDYCLKNERLNIDHSILRTCIFNASDDSFDYADSYNFSSLAKINGNRLKKLSVTSNSTMDQARHLCDKYKGSKRICILNFASATNPGGGVKNGSSAQEESLCRESTLYPCLDTQYMWSEYYEVNRRFSNRKYKDIAVYIPGIRIVRGMDKTKNEILETIPDYYSVDVITCPAPNLREDGHNRNNEGDTPYKISNMTRDEYMTLLKRRIRLIINIAIVNQVDVLVLGAFGCGAFRNDPVDVASVFKEVLFDEHLLDHFDEVVFPIYYNKYSIGNYKEFVRILTDCDVE